MTKTLIITYYWPPAGGPGVQRWLHFANYFREYGVKPVVFIPENPSYPIIDNELLAKVLDSIEVIKFPIKEPYRFAKIFSKSKTKNISKGIIPKKNSSILEKLLLYIRGNYFIPDARVAWVKPSITFLSDYISKNNIDVVITTGPPHSLHLIGLNLKEKQNIKWLADFRDPWTTIHYHKHLKLSNASAKKHKELEKKVLKSADLITVTSPTTKKEFQVITDKPIEVVTNGFEKLNISEEKLDSKFTISHIGSLLSGRNPKNLWETLAFICEENKDFTNDLKIRLIGATSDEVIKEIAKNKLSNNLETINYVSHPEALKIQRNTQILLLIESNTPETRAIIPGKLFEYLAAQRPILAFGPKKSDIETIVSETNSGKFYTHQSTADLKVQILDWYNQFKENKLSVSTLNIEKYSRKAISEKMANLVKELK